MSKENDVAVQIFSARACAAPLRDAAVLFEAKTGVRVSVAVCNRHCAAPVAEEAAAQSGNHDFLVEIAEDGIYDLAISGAEYLLDDGEVRGIVQKGERRLIACRRSAIVVPAGNPAGIRSLADLTKPGVRVAISVLDCLKGLWEDVTVRLGLAEQIRRNISFRANGCVAIVEAVAQNKVDAAFGWNTFEHLAPGRLEIVETPPAQQVWRGTGIGLLTTATHIEQARQLMDFLVTPEARACYQKYGWVVPGTMAV
jgi:molybdate transport system substrate-binding protein